VTRTVTKKGRNPGAEMAHMTVQWDDEDFRIVIFPEVWARYKYLVIQNTPVACWVKKIDGGCALDSMVLLEDFCNRQGL